MKLHVAFEEDLEERNGKVVILTTVDVETKR